MLSRWTVIACLLCVACEEKANPAPAPIETSNFPADPDLPWDKIAVYVGINDYAHDGIHDLTGCVNDVRRVRHALRSHGFLRDAVLVDKSATRENFKQLGIDLALQVKEARANKIDEPLVVIFYAGHGDRIKQGDILDEKEKHDNSFVTHDSNPNGERDIRDDDIYRLISHLQSKELNATVVMFVDACHSASSFRASPAMPVRSMQHRGKKGMGDGPPDALFEWTPGTDDRLASFAACSDVAVAGETMISGVPSGKFSHVLVELLESGTPIESYQDLGHALQRQFAITFPGAAQRPRFYISGSMKGRRVFGKERAPNHARVLKVSRGVATISAGSLHGVGVGDTVDFYKDLRELRVKGMDGAVSTGEVTAVDPGTSAVKLDKPDGVHTGGVARPRNVRAPGFALKLGPDLPEHVTQLVLKLVAQKKFSLANGDEEFDYLLWHEKKSTLLAVHAPDQLPGGDKPGKPFFRVNYADGDVASALVWLGQQHRIMHLSSMPDLVSFELLDATTGSPFPHDTETGAQYITSGADGETKIRVRIRSRDPKLTLHFGILLLESEIGGDHRINGELYYPIDAGEQVESSLSGNKEWSKDLPLGHKWKGRPSRLRFKLIATDRKYDFERLAKVMATPFLGTVTDGPNRGGDTVLDFVEDRTRGRPASPPKKRVWATADAVLDLLPAGSK